MKKQNAFTLIELMLVVMIIATLAALVMPKFTGRAQQAMSAAARADIQVNIPTALELYELDNGFYPTTEQGLASLRQRPSTAPLPHKWAGPYIKKNPLDPWGNPYHYQYPGIRNPDTFDLFSYGSDGVEGGNDDIDNWENS